MKKLSILFAIICVFVLQLSVVNADSLKGDVNEDGIVSVKDETLIGMYINGKITDANKKKVLKNGDLNNDGIIDEEDAKIIQSINLGEYYDGNVNLDKTTYNNMNTEYASCGDGMISDVPISVPKVVNIAYTALQIAVPVILVVMGMITLIKAIISSKEDEIKKAQMSFVKKLIVGALVFFVFVIVKLLVSVAGDADKTPDIIDCANCFLNGTDNCKITKSK